MQTMHRDHCVSLSNHPKQDKMVTRKRKVHLEHALPATQDPTCYADLQAMTQLPWDDFPPIATGESPATLPLAQPMPSAPDHGPPMLSSSIPMDMAVEPTLAMSAPDGPTSDHEVCRVVPTCAFALH